MPTSIAITNASFEQDDVDDGANTTSTATGWVTSGAGGVFDPELPYVFYSSMDGDQLYNISSTVGSISQTLAQTYDSNNQYTFSVDVGDPDYTESVPYTYNLYAGTTLVGTVSGNTGSTDTLETVTLTSGVPNSLLDGQTVSDAKTPWYRRFR